MQSVAQTLRLGSRQLTNKPKPAVKVPLVQKRSVHVGKQLKSAPEGKKRPVQEGYQLSYVEGYKDVSMSPVDPESLQARRADPSVGPENVPFVLAEGLEEIPETMKEQALLLRDWTLELAHGDFKGMIAGLMADYVDQVRLLQRTAQHSGKDVRDVTALDAAALMLEEQNKVASETQLDQVVLFSHERALSDFQRRHKNFAAMFPDNTLPDWLAVRFEEQEYILQKNVENQEIVEIKVDEDVYNHTQKNLFPPLQSNGVTPQEYLDFLGGPEALIDPVTWKVRDIVVPMLAATETSEKVKWFNQFHEVVAANVRKPEELSDHMSDEAILAKALAQERARDLLSLKVGYGRDVKVGDLTPERRLAAGGVTISHPLLDNNQRFYVHGDVSNMEVVPKLFDVNSPMPTLEFEPRADFNPPTFYRETTEEQLALHPKMHNTLQKKALDFPSWEGVAAASAINSYELIAEMKLRKLFHYMYPALAEDTDGQRLFMENYDVSPGEATLEWALSYPATEHTFFPEHPLWAQVFEDDEEFPPVVWPKYSPILIEGAAQISSAANGSKVTIKFLDQTQEEHDTEAYLHSIFSKYSLDDLKKNYLSVAQVSDAMHQMTEQQKTQAIQHWKGLTPEDRKNARLVWDMNGQHLPEPVYPEVEMEYEPSKIEHH